MSLERWRLVLGKSAELGLGMGLQGDVAACDAALSWLYQEGDEERDIKDRQAGNEDSILSVPDWISEVHRLFPKETIERMEKDAVERYQIHEVVTNPEVLQRVQPSQAMLEAVLRTKHLMNQDLLALARDLVKRVVEDLIAKLSQELKRAFQGGMRARRSTPFKLSRDLDVRRTIRANLRHYDPAKKRLVLEKVYFFPRHRRHLAPWQLILLVDQSGSMVSSVIHSAVTAACLWGLPSLKTHLIAFDTSVVDLTSEVQDPVELLMKVQLGGGTDIAKAVDYASGLIEQPRRTIVAVVTDFYEGGNQARLVQLVKALCDQGTHVLGLAALDNEDVPNYDRGMAARWAAVGAHVAAMSPGHLANWVAEKVLS
jgi:uncharacterized protein with von Willebrand factor type A (vWA) domain